jgi:hypothetical protein
MHTQRIDADTIIAALGTLEARELDRVRAAIEAMSSHPKSPMVLER